MLIVLIILGIALTVGGAIIKEKRYQKDLGDILEFIGTIIAGASILAIITCGIILSNRMVINDKIALYQTENKNIEEQISSTVEGYKKYEQDTLKSFKNNSPIILVTLYPELKTNQLVNKQIDLYIANNKKIKELKEQKLDYVPLAWWIYFGH